jgi:gag-polypeptide of LTR copia-type/Zinc knuckle
MTDHLKITPFDGNNWYSFADAVEGYALEKGFWHAPLSTLAAAPPRPGPNDPPVAPDTPNMQKLRGFLSRHVGDAYRSTVLQADTVVYAWFGLQAAAINSSYAQRSVLRQEFQELAKDPSETIDEYFSRARLLTRRLEDASSVQGVRTPVIERDRVEQILRGLPVEYEQQRTALTVAEHMPSLQHVAAVLRDREASLAKAVAAPPAAFAAQQHHPPAMGSTQSWLAANDQWAHVLQAAAQQAAAMAVQQMVAQQPPWAQQQQQQQQPWGQQRQQQPQAPAQERRAPICYNCGVTGHRWQQCPKPLTPALLQQQQQSRGGGRRGEFHSWLLDSGASSHICNDRNAMLDLERQAGR